MGTQIVESYVPERLLGDVTIDLPEQPTNLKFVFGFHQFPGDIPETVSEQIGHPDMLLVEQVNHVPGFEEVLNQIPKATADELENMKTVMAGAHWLLSRQAELIWDAKPQRVGINDVPFGHPIAQPVADVLMKSENRLRQKLAMSRSPAQMVNRTRQHLAKELTTHADREIFMAREVYRRIGLLAAELDRPTDTVFLVGPDHICLEGLLKQKIAELGQSDRHTIVSETVGENLPLHPLADIKRSFYMGEDITDDQIARYIPRVFLPTPHADTYAETLIQMDSMLGEAFGGIETYDDFVKSFAEL